MHTLPFCVLGALACAAGLAMAQGCSSKSNASSADAGDDGAAVLACPAATDAGVIAAADAGVASKIVSPTNGQRFTSKDVIPVHGVGSDPSEGTITDQTRMIWYVGDAIKGPAPDGEGPDDQVGPYPAGTYVIRFDVSNAACVTAADSVSITIE